MISQHCITSASCDVTVLCAAAKGEILNMCYTLIGVPSQESKGYWQIFQSLR